MDLESYRRERGLTQQQAANELGLASKGYFSRLESGKDPMPLRMALKIETWSCGKVAARDICAAAADLLPAPTDAAA
jgi:transcriptional regulator with XRE-family HTH domain